MGKIISAQIDSDVHEALEKRARDEERTLSWMVNKLLRQVLVIRKPKRGKGKP